MDILLAVGIAFGSLLVAAGIMHVIEYKQNKQYPPLVMVVMALVIAGFIITVT